MKSTEKLAIDKMTPIKWILLGCIAIVSGLIRSLPQLGQVFADGSVYFKGVDPYYHMRLVDFCVANYPKLLTMDPYAAFGGAAVGYYPLMTLMISSIAVLLGGQGNSYLVDTVGAWFPVVMGTIGIVIIFFIGRYIFNSDIGLGAAIIAAITPSEFLHRSTLGFTDHHIVEAVLFFCLILFLWLMWTRKQWRWAICGGVCLGLYLMNWWGALVMMLLVDGWLVIQFLIQRKQQEDVKFLCLATAGVVGIGVLVASPVIISWALDPKLYYVGLGASLLLPWLLLSIAKIELRKLLILGICGCIIAGLAITAGLLWSPITQEIGILCPSCTSTSEAVRSYGSIVTIIVRSVLATFWGFDTTIEEALPTDIQTAFYTFGSQLIFFFVGVYVLFKKYRKGKEFFVIVTMFLVLMMIGQRRWSYYGMMPLSICISLSMFWISDFFRKDMKRMIFTTIIILSLITNAKATIIMASFPGAMSKDWREALTWLKSNSDDPFGGNNTYITLNEMRKSDYTVMSWWDYGHWIIRLSKRVPLTSPTSQGVAGSPDCRFMTYTNLEEAETQLKGLRIKYIIVDAEMVSGKFYAIVERYRSANLLTTTRKDFQEAYDNGILLKLWKEELPTYKLIYLNNTVKIFQVPQEVYGGPKS